MTGPKLVPQALQTTYPARLSTFNTALITPVIQTVSAPSALGTRTTKRGTTIINYAEIEDDDDDIFEDRVDQVNQRGRYAPRPEGELAMPKPVVYGDGIQSVVELPGKEVQRPVQLHFPRTQKQKEGAALRPERLIPIRLDLDVDGIRKLKDTFLWNLHEMLITPEEFAAQMVADLQLPTNLIGQIASSIRQQCEEYAPIASVDLPESESFPIIVSLNIHLRNSLFTDKFEWDLSSSSLAPEVFAKQTCADLALSGEFRPAISHAIYEATMKSKKEILETPSILSTHVPNDAAFDARAGWRVDNDFCEDWAPRIEVLSREEIEKREGDRDRELRRLRRESSRFGSGGVWEEETMGRGERKRKKNRRSVSPSGRGGTPAQGSGVSDWHVALGCFISG